MLSELDKLLKSLSSGPSPSELAALDSKHKVEANLKTARNELAQLESTQAKLAQRRAELKRLLSADSTDENTIPRAEDPHLELSGRQKVLVEKGKALNDLQRQIDAQDRKRAQMLISQKRFGARTTALSHGLISLKVKWPIRIGSMRRSMLK